MTRSTSTLLLAFCLGALTMAAVLLLPTWGTVMVVAAYPAARLAHHVATALLDASAPIPGHPDCLPGGRCQIHGDMIHALTHA